MARKVCWMFINKDVEGGVKRQVMPYGNSEMHTVGVASYEIAAETAKKLVEEEGVIMIELCGGFGSAGVAMVEKAIDYKVPVGAIRFENHPGYGGESGDIRWLGINKE